MSWLIRVSESCKTFEGVFPLPLPGLVKSPSEVGVARMAAIGRQTHHEPIKGVGAAIGAHTHHPPPTLVLGASRVADEVDVLLTEQGVLAEVGEQL